MPPAKALSPIPAPVQFPSPNLAPILDNSPSPSPSPTEQLPVAPAARPAAHGLGG